MDTYQIFQLMGISSLISAGIGAMITKLISFSKQNKALKLGLQALLRAQMVNDYNKWSAKGYAPIYARENFENCWKQYETLGENGVMNDIHTKFLALPTPTDNKSN